MKEFKIFIEEISEGDNNLNSIDYIKAKNINSAINKAVKEFLTPKQRRNLKPVYYDQYTVSFVFESRIFDIETDQELKNVEYNEDTMYYIDSELTVLENEK